MTEAEGHNCDAIAGIDLDSKGIIYSGIFYFYNRLIQQNYNLSSLSESDIENADKIGRMVHAAAKNCLPPELATDAALIDFGRATIYSEDRGKTYAAHVVKAKAAAQDFLTSIKGNEFDVFSTISHLYNAEVAVRRSFVFAWCSNFGIRKAIAYAAF